MIIFPTLFSTAGAFAAFFTTAYGKKDETEFQIAGIKGRPLPEVPKTPQFNNEATTNGTMRDESHYAEIPARQKPENLEISPYAEFSSSRYTKQRTDTVSEDSAPSSPTRNVSQGSFNEPRSRSSTQNSRGSRGSDFDDQIFSVPHDSTGDISVLLPSRKFDWFHFMENRLSTLASGRKVFAFLCRNVKLNSFLPLLYEFSVFRDFI